MAMTTGHFVFKNEALKIKLWLQCDVEEMPM